MRLRGEEGGGEHAGEPVPVACGCPAALDDEEVRETHYLRQYMAQLRHKLERDPAHPRHLHTEPGMGYRFQP
jgi:DNA-binding response OmpR family regulator